MNKKLMLFSMMVLSFTPIIAQAWIFESPSVKAVKSGSHNACPAYSIEMLYSNVMKNIEWKSFVDGSGQSFVNVSGTMYLQGSPVHSLVQYGVGNGDVIYISAVELNGRLLNDYAISQMIDEMCMLADEQNVASQASQQGAGGPVKATVLSVGGYGEEGVLLSTEEGEYRFNFFALDDGDYELMEEAARVNGTLCVYGQDPVYKDSISADC